MGSSTETLGSMAKAARGPRFATFLLGSSMFATGASGLVNEYILATVSTYILGNSIEQFGIIIALMLMMMGLASWVQKWVSDELLIEKFIAVEILLAILCSSGPLAIYAAYGLMSDHFELVQYFFVISIGFLIGFEIPLVLRINRNYADYLKTNLATILSLDYIGSFIGAIIWVFFLLRHFPLTEIGPMVAGFNFLVAAVTFLYFLRHRLVSLRVLPILGIVITLGWLGTLYSYNRDWNLLLEQKMYDDPIVWSRTTRYQHLVVTYNKVLEEYRLYINGNTQFSSVDEAIYHEQLVHPVMSLAPDPKRVLILGGGDGLALREVLKYRDVRSVVLVDLDPVMTQVAATNPIFTRLNNNAFADARVHVEAPKAITSEGQRPVFVETGRHYQYGPQRGQAITERVATVDVINLDADKFIGEIPGYYNVIIVDFPDPGSIELVKLYSKEFYLKLKKRLAENGMVVLQATSPYHAKASYLCIQRTMEAAGLITLPYHDNVPSFGDWGWLMGWTAQPVEAMRERVSSIRFDVATRYLTQEVFQASLIFGKGALIPKPENESTVNTLMFPVLLHYYLKESWLID